MEKENLKELELFVEYAVEKKEQKVALSFIKNHQNSPVLMALCKEFYSALPEAREEALLKVVLIEAVQGTFLLGAKTIEHKYLYCADHNSAVLLGEYEKGIESDDVLTFFGFASNEQFKDQLKSFKKYPQFSGELKSGKKAICPICSAKSGELHQLGCSVEVCPWCEGQLSNCNCRFEKIGVEEISTDKELEMLEKMLLDKGRVPFTEGQGLAYPVAGDDKIIGQQR